MLSHLIYRANLDSETLLVKAVAMKFIFATLVGALVGFLFAQNSFARDLITVDIPHGELLNSPTVDVYINGEGPFPFILDTGAGRSHISQELAEKLEVKSEPIIEGKISDVKGFRKAQITQPIKLGISGQKVTRLTRLYISPKSNVTNLLYGKIGIADLKNAFAMNLPEEKILRLKLPEYQETCDLILEPEHCEDELRLPMIDMTLGGKDGFLLVDTGNEASPPLVMLGSDVNTQIWNKYSNALESIETNTWSTKPTKRIRTQNFLLNRDIQCIADIYIRDPEDGSPHWGASAIASLGWSVLHNVSFVIDFNTGVVQYPSVCPYNDKNKAGIKGLGFSADRDQAYISHVETHSAAYKSGVRTGDIINRVTLNSGRVIERFDDSFTSTLDQHLYAKAGTKFTVSILRDEETFDIEVTTEDPVYIDLKL